MTDIISIYEFHYSLEI